MSKEIWKKIDGYKGLYEVSSRGRVRSYHLSARTGYRPGPHVLAPGNLRGYRFVSLPKLNGEGRTCPLIHCLVAEAFMHSRPVETGHRWTVNHKDFDKANNRVENLEWLSSGDNNRYSKDVIPRNRGQQCWNAKLTDAKVREIRARWQNRESATSLAKAFGVSLQTCSAIVKRKKWAHVP